MRPCQVQTRTHHHPCTAAVFRCRSAEARFLTSNFPGRNTYLTRAGMYWGRAGEGRRTQLLENRPPGPAPVPLPSRSPSALIFGTLNHPRVTDALGIFSLKFFRSIPPSPSPEAKPATFWSFHPPKLQLLLRSSPSTSAAPHLRPLTPPLSRGNLSPSIPRLLPLLTLAGFSPFWPEQARRRTLNIDVSSSEIPRHQL